MRIRRPLSTSLTVLAALALTGAAWSWGSAVSARAPLGDLESQVAGLRQEVGHLRTLSDLPPLPPLAETLRHFLGSVQPPWAVKFAGPPDQDPNAFKPVPNMAGVRVVVLEVTDPKPAADLPQVGLAALARWQERWPLQVTRAVWNRRALVATLTLYGR